MWTVDADAEKRNGVSSCSVDQGLISTFEIKFGFQTDIYSLKSYLIDVDVDVDVNVSVKPGLDKFRFTFSICQLTSVS